MTRNAGKDCASGPRGGRRGVYRGIAGRSFFDAYRRELKRPPASHGLSLLATLAKTAAIAVGCYCADETRCHRFVLMEEIERAARRQA